MREVSRIATENGDYPGWSDKAFEHRKLMHEHHIRNMEAYLKPKTKYGRREGDPPLTRDQKRDYQKRLRMLRDVHLWNNKQIAAALELATEGAVVRALKEGSGTLSRLQAVTNLLDTLAKKETTEARIAASAAEATPPPPPPSPAQGTGPNYTAVAPVSTEGAANHSRVEALKIEVPSPPKTSFTDPVEEVRRTGKAFIGALKLLEAALPAIARPAVAAVREKAAALVEEVSQ